MSGEGIVTVRVGFGVKCCFRTCLGLNLQLGENEGESEGLG